MTRWRRRALSWRFSWRFSRLLPWFLVLAVVLAGAPPPGFAAVPPAALAMAAPSPAAAVAARAPANAMPAHDHGAHPPADAPHRHAATAGPAAAQSPQPAPGAAPCHQAAPDVAPCHQAASSAAPCHDDLPGCCAGLLCPMMHCGALPASSASAGTPTPRRPAYAGRPAAAIAGIAATRLFRPPIAA